MANTKKLTKRDHFNTLLTLSEVKSNPALVDFINHEIELLAKKNSADKKPTAQQTANAEIAEVIFAHMVAEPNRLFTIGELIKEVEGCGDFTTSKMSAIVRVNLLEKGRVKRTEDKRKAYFQAVVED